jgi:FHS family L-fucose permease-like MFS transporter
MPIFQGLLSDANGGNMQIAYSVPLLCFVAIVLYAVRCMRQPQPVLASSAAAVAQ